eukprot:gene2141-2639_t
MSTSTTDTTSFEQQQQQSTFSLTDQTTPQQIVNHLDLPLNSPDSNEILSYQTWSKYLSSIQSIDDIKKELIRVFIKDDNQNEDINSDNKNSSLQVVELQPTLPLKVFKVGVSWQLVSPIIERATGLVVDGLKIRNGPDVIEASPYIRSGDYTIIFAKNKRINVSSKGVFKTKKETIEFQQGSSPEFDRSLILNKFGQNPKTVTDDRLVQNSNGYIVTMDSNLIDSGEYQLQIPFVRYFSSWNIQRNDKDIHTRDSSNGNRLDIL